MLHLSVAADQSSVALRNTRTSDDPSPEEGFASSHDGFGTANAHLLSVSMKWDRI